MIKRLMMYVTVLLSLCVWSNGRGNVLLGGWYEALVDDEGCTCARWDDFHMGANVAIPVIGLSNAIADSAVVVKAGTYSEFGTPFSKN